MTRLAQFKQVIDLFKKYDGYTLRISKETGIPHTTVRRWMDNPVHFEKIFSGPQLTGQEPEAVELTDMLKDTIKTLRFELSQHRKENLDENYIKEKIIGLKDSLQDVESPAWVIKARKTDDSPGVPTLFLSDLHWGEVIDASEINNVNEYDLHIAHQRMHSLIETAVHLLRIISPKMDYPGIVIPLGGDMISGNIHEELTATNELNSMPTVLDLYDMLARTIAFMADTFGHVFLPCVSGNHGRDTKKIWKKDRHHTSFDWLLYCFLAKHFENDKRIQFFIPDGPDALYRVYDHRYLLTHGDSFRGGDGLIGCLGPIIRGDHKKRSRNAQVDMEYDTMILGHFHQHIHHSRVIVNGSLKGYDEYAYSGNFGFEPPQQALWLTHPRFGITYRMPVYVDKPGLAIKTDWVSFAAGAKA